MTQLQLDTRPPGWPFGELLPAQYGVIYADSEWQFANYSEAGEAKNPNQHYRCSSIEELCARPVGMLAKDDAVLVMWATFPMLQEAFQVMKAWGFRYVAGGPWCKRSSTGQKWQFGPGYVFRGAAELFLIGKKGNPRQRDVPGAHSVRNLIMDPAEPEAWADNLTWVVTSPVREHSRKPDEMITAIETLFHGPYLELNARTRRPGWDSWGDQVDKFTP